jgi:2,3-bisphosphoglycerate-independent phosphoglycerate mutase
MNDNSKIIMIMVDGFGIPVGGWDGSVYAEYCSTEFMDLLYNYSIPLDAALRIPGIPQSATGQTALFTGINAAEAMNKHHPGFPGPTLKKIIKERNIFKTLLGEKKSVSFANAYVKYSLEKIAASRFCSVTSYMVSNTINKVFDSKSLVLNKSVYHDITRETIAAKHNIPTVSSEAAANHLLGVSKNVDFTLFEYFMTDVAGHRQNKNILKRVLNVFSRFIAAIKASLPDDTLLLITSDHGNCENLSTSGHTNNPVPLIYYPKNSVLPKAKSIVDVYNLIVEVLS